MIQYELRDYQQEAVQAGIECFNGKKNGVIVAPTGSGKSLLIAFIAKQLGGKTIVLQPSKEILEQNLQKMRSFGYADIGVYSASMGKKYLGDITFATIGSIVNKKHLFEDYDRLIIDECHLCNSKGGMYEEFINHLDMQVVGLTATPYRLRNYCHHATGENIAEARIITRTRPKIFNKIIHVTQVKDLFEQGYLCKLDYQNYDDYDCSKIQLNSTGMGYKDESLASYNKSQKITDKIINAVCSSNAKHCLAFTQFRSESQEVVEGLRKHNIRCEEVSGETPKDQRESILTSFKMGVIKCVVNVNVLSIGFDFPELDCIVIGKPTNSVVMYYQVLGRGVRLAEGKESCKVIDLCNNVSRFGHIETFEMEDTNGKGLYRLKSDKGYLTETDLISGDDLDSPRFKHNSKEDAPLEDMIIPFGKFKDKKVAEVSNGYLYWAAKNMTIPKWKSIFARELQQRRSL